MLCSLFVVISTLLVSYGIEAEASEGDPCSLSEDLFGECRSIENCPDAFDNVRTGEWPVLCDSFGVDLIVCCPIARNADTNPTTLHLVTTQRTDKAECFTPEASRQCKCPGELAKQKCAQYARTVLRPEESSGSSVTKKPFRLSNYTYSTFSIMPVIVNGDRVRKQEFPHMTAVGFNATSGIVWLCGGTLVSENFVVTAAHCTSSIEYGNAIWVKVGVLNLERDTYFGKPQERRIAERIRHPLYKKPSLYHDIALLRLENPVVFNAYVRPACLPASSHYEGSVIATGWGVVDWTDEKGSSDLLKVVLSIVDQSSCNSSFVGRSVDSRLEYGIIDDWQICARGRDRRDTCNGDSGGPLSRRHQDHASMYEVVGITSLGRVCGTIVPGVYTRVYNYICWLESIIWQA